MPRCISEKVIILPHVTNKARSVAQGGRWLALILVEERPYLDEEARKDGTANRKSNPAD